MAEPLLTAELDAIEARAEAATPGPWQTAGGNRIIQPKMFQRHAPGSIVRIGETFGLDLMDGPNSMVAHENATFIAHGREDVPKLLAEVRRLRAVLEAVRAELDQSCDYGGDCRAFAALKHCDAIVYG